jgi:imidazolonepropionase-like amidohydrolase
VTQDEEDMVNRTFVIRNAYVLDESGGFEGPTDTVVVDGVIEALGWDLTAPDDAPEHDFGGLWLLPGIFDCHTHPMYAATTDVEPLRTPITQWVLEGAQALRRTLEAGVTFVRDCAGADPGIRDSIDRGFIAGPRLQVSLNQLCQTGGHSDTFLQGLGCDFFWSPQWPGRPTTIVDGADEMRRVVRQLIRAGVDWIKLCSTGGIMSLHDAALAPHLTEEEIRTAVFEAKRSDKGVMSHAYGGEGLDYAVRAGVRSIEHGLFLTEEQAAQMAAAGCWLIPTLSVVHDLIGWARAAQRGEPSPLAERPTSVVKALALEPLVGQAVEIAKAAGVRLAIGSDFVTRDQHGRNLGELAHMRRAGLSPEETLLAATAHGAELCGVADRYGRIAPGYAFDAIVLDEDPGDLSLFDEPGAVKGVFKGGAPVVSHERVAVL